MTGEFRHISPTAFLIAYLRQFTDIPFAPEIAAAARAEEVSARFLHESGVAPIDLVRGNAPQAEARYKCIVAALRASGIRQVLELGCGLAPRGLAMTDDPGITYVDSDLAGIVEERSRILREIPSLRARAEAPNLHVQPANILSTEDIASAVQWFDPSLPVAVVHEGLLGYLSFAEKGVAARTVRDVLGRFGGAWITPDLLTTQMIERGDRSDPTRARAHAAVAKNTQRRFAENAFADDGHIQEFFGRCGFAVEVKPQLDGSFELSSLGRLNLPEEHVSSFAADLRVWTMRPL